jgi:hypothetical protein
MSDKSLKDSPKLPKSPTDDIEDWDDFEEVDLSKKWYVSDETRENMSIARQEFASRTLNSRKQSFLSRCKDVHGDKYDYSKVDYLTQNEKITIICPEHGEFNQLANHHLHQGNGCPKCRTFNKPTQQKVLEDFRSVHGNKYDYSKVDYKGANIKVIVICPKHGEFSVSPSNHKRGVNCNTCSQLHSPQKVLEDFRGVHGDKYDYSKVVYVRNHDKVIIICPEHGEFLQAPSAHKRGQGCRKCGNGKRRIKT